MPPSARGDKKWTTQATEKVLAALNRADEIGGEVRDYLQDRVAADPRYVSARKAMAKLLGRTYESRNEVTHKAQAQAEKVAAAAAVTTEKVARGLGDPAIKAQIYGKKSCPWTGRAITLLERHKVDFDFVDLEEPEHEAKSVPLALETRQTTVPYIYLRGRFVGGFNALSRLVSAAYDSLTAILVGVQKQKSGRSPAGSTSRALPARNSSTIRSLATSAASQASSLSRPSGNSTPK